MRAGKRRLIVLLSCIAVLGAIALQVSPVLGQAEPEPFWIAIRYDSSRVIIYFDAVKFNNTVPPNAPSVGDSGDVELPASYIATFLKEPGAYRFELGEEYDVLIPGGAVAVKLTTLVGAEGDEGVGNDSYIGALATVVGECHLYDQQSRYIVRRHQEPVCGSKLQPGQTFPTKYATLISEPMRFDIQTQIVSLMTERMKSAMSSASDAQRRALDGLSPEFTVQPFQVADGSLRYYASAAWKTGKEASGYDFHLGAWLDPAPTVHILAFETNQNFNLPTILNIGDLGGGKTGIILANSGEDWGSTDLVEYADGVDSTHMRKIQSLSAGE
jgi:hypothetical protein